MRDTIIMEVNGQQSLHIQARLWVRLICECDLYAKIYGSPFNTDCLRYRFNWSVRPGLRIICIKWPTPLPERFGHLWSTVNSNVWLEKPAFFDNHTCQYDINTNQQFRVRTLFQWFNSRTFQELFKNFQVFFKNLQRLNITAKIIKHMTISLSSCYSMWSHASKSYKLEEAISCN